MDFLFKEQDVSSASLILNLGEDILAGIVTSLVLTYLNIYIIKGTLKGKGHNNFPILFNPSKRSSRRNVHRSLCWRVEKWG